MLDWWHQRLSRVQLDCRDALTVIQYWDSVNTVFYIDPPYLHDTRVVGSAAKYHHECSDEHHRELVDLLLNIQGQVMLSGYPHISYDPLVEAGWQRMTKKTACHAAGRTRGSGLQGAGAALAKAPRTEALWIKRNEGQETLLERMNHEQKDCE